MKSVMTSKAVMGDGMMKKVSLWAVAGLLGLSSFAAMADFTGNVGVSTNYVFRGVSLSGNSAQVSGGLDYSHSSGLYAGTWISNISGAYEWDLYGGYSGEYQGFGYDVGYLYYKYPALNNADYGEVYGSLSYKWFTAGVAYTVNSQVNRSPLSQDLFIPGDVYFYGKASFDLGNDWSLGGTIGYYDFKEDKKVTGLKASYVHGRIDLTKSAGKFGDFTASLSLAEKAPASGATGDLIPLISWSKSF
jgi:uncharacterized protein (TIGR02001 family)